MNQNKKDKTRPDKVSTALKLLYLTFVLSVISFIFNIDTTIKSLPPQLEAFSGFFVGFTIFISILSLAFFGFLIYKIGKGRNWARITFLVLSVIGILPAIISAILSLTINPIPEVFSIIEKILEIIILVLLFQKSSSNWFNSMKSK